MTSAAYSREDNGPLPQKGVYGGGMGAPEYPRGSHAPRSRGGPEDQAHGHVQDIMLFGQQGGCRQQKRPQGKEQGRAKPEFPLSMGQGVGLTRGRYAVASAGSAPEGRHRGG
jgi:hypothetical protein